MALHDIYMKFRNSASDRKEMCCLKSELNTKLCQYVIRQESDEYFVPDEYLKLVRMNEKPEIPEGKFIGYHFKKEDGVMKRWYLVCDGKEDKQLLVVDDYEEAVQKYLDQVVQQKGYDNVYTCLTYKDDPDPIFSAEAAAVLAWRSQVWRTAQGILNQWMSGKIQQPTISDVLAFLPTLDWPEVES